jgi:NAD(P)H-nitrite reductase large subunit
VAKGCRIANDLNRANADVERPLRGEEIWTHTVAGVLIGGGLIGMRLAETLLEQAQAP